MARVWWDPRAALRRSLSSMFQPAPAARPIDPEIIADAGRRLATVALHLIAGGRHAYFWENRPEASQLVLAFLARHPLDG